MSPLHRSLMLALLAGLVLGTFASDTSSASMVPVQANISFQSVISAHKQSDVTFGGLQARPNDMVSLMPDGAMRLNGKGEVLSPFGSPSVIELGDSRDHVMNFVPGNYTPGQGIAALKANCIVKGAGRASCDSTPLYGKKENTLYIGMDVTVADDNFSIDNSKQPSFDMSVVYQ